MCCSNKIDPEVKTLLSEYEKKRNYNLRIKEEIEMIRQENILSEFNKILESLKVSEEMQRNLSRKIDLEFNLSIESSESEENEYSRILRENIISLLRKKEKVMKKIEKFEIFSRIKNEISLLKERLAEIQGIKSKKSEISDKTTEKLDSLRNRLLAKEKLKQHFREYIIQITKYLENKYEYYSEMGIDLEKVKINIKNISELENLEQKIKYLEEDINHLIKHKTNLETNSDDSLDEDIENFCSERPSIIQ